MITYRELSPRDELREHVHSLYELRINRPAHGASWQTVLPDGTVELNIPLASPIVRSGGKDPDRTLAEAYLVGRFKQAYRLQRTGPGHVLGARFNPGGFTALTGIPVTELADRAVPAFDVLGPRVASLIDQVHEPCADRLVVLDSWLSVECGGASPLDPNVRLALARIAAAHGSTRTKDIAQGLSIGVRRLEQRFGPVVGMAPKAFSRLVRFRAALRAVRSAGRGDLMDVVVGCGFYDQSHLVREFRCFAGMTPEHYRRGLFPLNDLTMNLGAQASGDA